ncbi:MAG: hemerythrin family protein [Polyangiaceae bacterium]|nr:hemerythrin family protein [Polyangiaceae bacterium]
MGHLRWSSSLELGIPEIDEQHQSLVSILNAAHDALDREDASELSALVQRLQAYVVDHFAAEERILEACGYSGLASHVAQHRALASQLGNLIQDLREGDPDVGVALTELLRNWLVNHITVSDRAYAAAVLSSRSRRS